VQQPSFALSKNGEFFSFGENLKFILLSLQRRAPVELGEDSQNSFWRASFRTARRELKGGQTWWVLVAGEGRRLVATRKGRQERGRELNRREK